MSLAPEFQGQEGTAAPTFAITQDEAAMIIGWSDGLYAQSQGAHVRDSERQLRNALFAFALSTSGVDPEEPPFNSDGTPEMRAG